MGVVCGNLFLETRVRKHPYIRKEGIGGKGSLSLNDSFLMRKWNTAVTATTPKERKEQLYNYMIARGFDKNEADYDARCLSRYWVPELEQNFIEWVNHSPFSVIEIGEVDIPSVLTFWHSQNFCAAMECIYKYRQDGCSDPAMVYLEMTARI